MCFLINPSTRRLILCSLFCCLDHLLQYTDVCARSHFSMESDLESRLLSDNDACMRKDTLGTHSQVSIKYNCGKHTTVIFMVVVYFPQYYTWEEIIMMFVVMIARLFEHACYKNRKSDLDHFSSCVNSIAIEVKSQKHLVELNFCDLIE